MTTFGSLDVDLAAVVVAIVDDDPRLRTRLVSQLGDAQHAAAYASVAAMAAKVEPGPVVAVFGPSLADARGLASIADHLREHTDTAAVLVVDELSTVLLQEAIRAGISDVITVPEQPGPLTAAVGRAALDRRHAPAAGGPPGADEPSGPKGRVVTVFSTKGGVGKSVVATNLAVALARRSDQPVCLLDADLQFGDVAVLLKLMPQHTIADAIGAPGHVDSALIQSLLMRHDRSGLLVMPAPTEPAFADRITAADIGRVINVLTSFCGTVVVDTPAHFTEVVIQTLEGSDDIVLVAGMDVPTIKNVKLGLTTLRLLNVPESKVKLVLNGATAKARIDVGEIEKALGLRADVLVPSDSAVMQSVNKGVPIVLDAPSSSVARSFEQLAGLFGAKATAGRAKRRLL